MKEMKISELYKYSWFADLAYVDWNDDNLDGSDAVTAAKGAKRTPEQLAQKIFNNNSTFWNDTTNQNIP